ncbi:hypothetical protein [Comamonas koreensis]|uniref:Uncharacterized protein n=1 Tax=Comamonas koreensis TaxID=160825 RepID=A0AAW4XSF1_9BURK|nr:hypothetical protein [Comamonas koreensis]MCD2164272.1 hypothetical protein [Comamonas koreensis]
MNFWTKSTGADNGSYCVWRLHDEALGLPALQALFPSGEADERNFVLFSTSGVHGTYQTIEEEQRSPGSGVTFMVIQPRLVMTRYGVVYPKSEEDFSFLKMLRDSSWAMMTNIGREA